MIWELHVTMPDGSVWAYQVMEIARHRAEHYAHEFDGDVERSLREDTLPLFAEDTYEIADWAANNMNESDMQTRALHAPRALMDRQAGWVNGEKRVVGGPNAAKESE